MKTAKRVTTNVMLDARAHDALRKTAEADARSVSSLVRKIIADWYAHKKMIKDANQNIGRRACHLSLGC